MEKVIFREKYPVYTMQILKKELGSNNIEVIIEYFKNQIEKHPSSQLISVFDNYAHTLRLRGKINPDIKAAQNIIFCFGRSINNTKEVSLRPRSLAVCELEDRFTIEFVEPPKQTASDYIIGWCESLLK